MMEYFTVRWAWFLPVLFVFRHGSVLGHCANNFGPLVIMGREFRYSGDLIEHELTHTKQIVMTCGLHAILYYCSKRYRFWSELRAYRASVRAGLSPEIAAQLMATGYGFNMTSAEICHLLRET
jgi:hypothetical protein